MPTSTFSQIVAPAVTSEFYEFYVVANNIIGSSVPSTSVTIQAAVIPSIPTDIRRV